MRSMTGHAQSSPSVKGSTVWYSRIMSCDVLAVELRLGVRDQLDCNAVDAREATIRTGGELGEPLVVALRQVRPNVAFVLDEDEVGVEQPRASREEH